MPAKQPSFTSPARPVGDKETDVYEDGLLRVEHDNYYVACDGQPLKLPRVEFLLLSRLVGNMTRVVKAQDLWRFAWGDSKPYNAESLRVHIYRLRSKLAPYGIQIETMVSVGYRLVMAVDASESRRESA
jgi:two-component system alkaline phosphatase synthesis response regulator PhoP